MFGGLQMKKLISCLLLLFSFSLIPVTVVNATMYNEDGLEVTEDGFVIDRGSSNKEESITDVMGTWGERNKPDAETMQEVKSWSEGTIGFLTSCIIWVIFAALFFTTACDLMYIGVPAVRPFLDGSYGGSEEGYSSYAREFAMEAQRKGDPNAAYLHQRANEVEASGSGVAHINEKNGQKSKKSFISMELRQIMLNQKTYVAQDGNFANYTGRDLVQENSVNQSSLMQQYMKKRAISIVLTVVVLLLLVGNSLFTDMGLNIGAALLKLLGF